MDLTDETPKRRRGASLEAALLDAAWAELVDVGYTALTYEGVARRAGTSRPVVYRRWRTKPELVLATLGRYYALHPIAIPDTGSLRSDLIAVLTEASAQRTGLITVLTLRLGGYFEETGTTLADLRAELLARAFDAAPPERRGRPFIRVVLEQAAARGEVDLARITPRIESLPFDLVRNEMFVSNGPVKPAAIESIVDEIFLPLISYDADGPRRSPAAR